MQFLNTFKGRLVVFLALVVFAMLMATQGEPAGFDIERLVLDTNVIVESSGSTGSGTILRTNPGLVLTAYHVVAPTIERGLGLKIIRRNLRYQDALLDDLYSARVLAHNKATDTAILQTDIAFPQIITTTPFLPEHMRYRLGDDVYIVGNPQGVLENSVTRGVVSGMYRYLEAMQDFGAHALQFSGGIIGGNSGGAVYTNDGYLIGVVTAMRLEPVFTPMGIFGVPLVHIGFATPIELIRSWMQKIGLWYKYCFDCVPSKREDVLSSS